MNNIPNFTYLNSSYDDSKEIKVPYCITYEYKEEMNRKNISKMRQRKIIENRKKEIRKKAIIRQLVSNVLFLTAFLFEISIVTFIFCFLGFVEHPTTGSDLSNRFSTALLQSTMFCALIDYICYEVANISTRVAKNNTVNKRNSDNNMEKSKRNYENFNNDKQKINKKIV